MRPRLVSSAGARSASGLSLQPQLAEKAIRTRIAEPLGLDLIAAAAGIYRIAVNNMVEAIRVNSVAKGYDPRDFTLVAYGGAGAAFVAEAARELSIPTVLVPPNPGVGAAAGLLATDTRFEHRNTLWVTLDGSDRERIDAAYAEMAALAAQQLADSGFAAEECEFRYVAECRYVGQGYELTVDVPATPADDDWLAAAREGFHSAHEQAYQRRFDERDVMIVNAGVVAIGRVPPLAHADLAAGGREPPTDAVVGSGSAAFLDGNAATSAEVRYIDRRRLLAGNVVDGPAIVEQADTTTVVPADMRATVDAFGNLLLTFVAQADG